MFYVGMEKRMFWQIRLRFQLVLHLFTAIVLSMLIYPAAHLRSFSDAGELYIAS